MKSMPLSWSISCWKTRANNPSVLIHTLPEFGGGAGVGILHD
jgi:hypothetical protein